MIRIAIIGAGLSGRLLALNLLRQASQAVSLQMIDRRDDLYMGPAYSCEADYLLLNVPAGRMGAFSKDPEHFMTWAQGKGVQAGSLDFLPRRLYKEYILDLLLAAQQHKNGPSFEHLRGEAEDIEISQSGVTLHLSGMAPVYADKVVLALGNFPPRSPFIQNKKALESVRYVSNPWATGILDGLEQDETVFLIGSGQTTVDLLVSLHKRAHQGPIIILSRRGLLPLVHRGFEVYPSFFEEIKDSKKILELLRIIRQHLSRAEAQGIDPRAVIDSLRPDAQALWRGLPNDEKRRFLRHAFRFWEIIRSRIPPESQAIIEEMRAAGQLEVLAGQIQDMSESESGLVVRCSIREETRDRLVRAALVINTIGPESDYSRVDQPLLKNLIKRGSIRPGLAQLGMDAQPNGAIIGRDGAISNKLYTLGPAMRGVLWEVLAVPEIRLQAEQLSSLLLETE